MAYATVEQLTGYLGQTTEADEALLEDILERAEALVDEQLQFSFAAYGTTATSRDVHCGSSGRYLYLPAHKSASVASVAALYSRGTTSETTVAITDYLAESRNRLFRAAGWQRGQWYRVSAIWGYGPVPTAIVEVTLEVAANLYRGRHTASWSSTVGAEGGGTVQVQRAVTWTQRSIIDQVKARYPRESIA
jgi:hypothetical protein